MSASSTRTGRKILAWRLGADVEEALVEGKGWCRYSGRLSAILIDGEWHTY